MRKSISNIVKVAVAAVTIGSLATPAMAQSWNGQDRDGYDSRYDRDDRDRRGYDRDHRDNDRGWNGGRRSWGRQLIGRGVGRLHPMLKGTVSGRRFAMQFDYNRDGRLSMNEAREANRQFVRMADRNGDAHITNREALRVL